MRRIGEPGGDYTFAFLAEDGRGTETIVYARGMITAILKYCGHYKEKPYRIRSMSDNE